MTDTVRTVCLLGEWSWWWVAILTDRESVVRLSDDCAEVEGKVSPQLMCCCSVLCCVPLTSLCSTSICSNSRNFLQSACIAPRFHSEKVEEGSIELVLPHSLGGREAVSPRAGATSGLGFARRCDGDANTEDVSGNKSREPKKEPEVNMEEQDKLDQRDDVQITENGRNDGDDQRGDRGVEEIDKEKDRERDLDTKKPRKSHMVSFLNEPIPEVWLQFPGRSECDPEEDTETT